jgi:TatD DNase family protein
MPIAADDNVFTLLNVNDVTDEKFSLERNYSIGIHPWHINDLDGQLDALKACISYPNVMAVGECGLDKLKGAPMEIQINAFDAQIKIANVFKKPLVIHCVQAYSEVISLLTQSLVPVIFHGFNKRITIANELLHKGYYLSFGADLLNEHSAAFKVFGEIPSDRFFLETDDASIDIKEVYLAASRIRKTTEDAIILQVQKNFKSVFNL